MGNKHYGKLLFLPIVAQIIILNVTFKNHCRKKYTLYLQPTVKYARPKKNTYVLDIFYFTLYIDSPFFHLFYAWGISPYTLHLRLPGPRISSKVQPKCDIDRRMTRERSLDGVSAFVFSGGPVFKNITESKVLSYPTPLLLFYFYSWKHAHTL